MKAANDISFSFSTYHFWLGCTGESAAAFTSSMTQYRPKRTSKSGMPWVKLESIFWTKQPGNIS